MTRTAPGNAIYLAVVGAGEASAELCEIAEAVGKEVAHRGAILVCGGLGGVMEAACRGAFEAGGTTVGILPGTDRSDANRWVTIALPSGLGEARNALVVNAADAVIAVGGEWGTLSEIALAVRASIPVVGIDTWELLREGRAVDTITRAGAPDEAVQAALDAVVSRRQ